jgi:hypothetical protein
MKRSKTMHNIVKMEERRDRIRPLNLPSVLGLVCCWHAECFGSARLPLAWEVQAQPVALSCLPAVRVLALQPPRHCVNGSRCLSLVAEGGQLLLLPIVVDSDSSPPLAALLVPAHAHELRRPLPLRRCNCCSLVLLSQQCTSLLCPLHLAVGGKVQPQLPSWPSC